MAIESLERFILEHPFFRGLEADFGRFICGCAQNVAFRPDEYLCREGEPADRFFLLRHGTVALEITAPGRPALTLQTIHEGEIVGVSWLVPPYRWTYDARALDRVGAIAMDARCLRGKIEENQAVGYELMKRFVPVLVERLHGTRLQALDLYAGR